MRRSAAAVLVVLAGVGGPLWAQSGQAGATAPKTVLTLEQALHEARGHQPQLRQARSAAEAAEARADEARAPLLPQITATAGYQRTTGNAINRPGAPPIGGGTHGSFTTFNSYSGSLALNQLLWDFGQSPNRWRSARDLAEAQELTARSTEDQVDQTVRSAFFDARTQKALAQVARASLQNLQRHLEQIEGFVRAGTRPPIDLAQARTDLANGRVQAITADNAYELSKATLNQAMGNVRGTDYDVADELLAPIAGEDGPEDALFAEAERARPELAALEAQVRAQLHAADAARGAFGPTISGQVGSTQGGTSLDSLGWNAAAGVSLTWGLFQGGLTRAQISEAEANAAAAAAQLDTGRLQVRLDVQQAQLAVRAARETLSATRDAVVNARVRLDLAEGRYQTGVGSAIELGDAQIALTTAQAQEIQAQGRLSSARAQLLRSLARK